MTEREVEHSGCRKIASYGQGQSVCEQDCWGFPCIEHNIARGWSYVINRSGRIGYRLHRGLQDNKKGSVSVEQGQLLRAAEPDHCVLKVKTPRQSDTVEFTHSLLGLCGKAADDLHRRRQDSDLEDATFARTDIAAETGRTKFWYRKKSLSTRPESVPIGRMSGDSVCAVSSVKMCQERSHCRTLLTRRDESRQFHETQQGIRMTVWVNVNHPSKRRRNRYLYSFHTHGGQITNATATDRLHAQCTINAEKQTSLFK